MGKSNKTKNAQNEPNQKLKIEEPDFSVDVKTLSAGEKKLLAQKQREQKEEEKARLRKEQEEANKKKNNNKKSNKTKKKTEVAPKPKEQIKNDFVETPKQKNTPNENYLETKTMPKEHETFPEKEENSVPESDPAWNWAGDNVSNYSNGRNGSFKPNKNENLPETGNQEGGNWRNRKVLKNVSKPSYSNERNSSRGGNYYYNLQDGKNDKEFQNFLSTPKKFNGKVREEQGDLFNAPVEYSLAHCVAEDFSMGAGIAKEFKAKFKRLNKLYDQKAKTGGLAILEDDARFIYYLVTKKVSRGKPTLYTLWQSLLKLRDHMVEHKVTKLAIPQIGCGLDKLDWFDVKGMMEYIFNKIEIDIVVYILEFNAAETPTPSKAPRTCFVVHTVLPLVEIQSQTGLIFFGTENGDVSHEMEGLATKYNFVSEYKGRKKSTSDVFKIVDRGEYLYGLIIKRSINDQINFAAFEKCLINLRKMLKDDKTTYIGLQGFVEKDDEVITEKLVNLMKHILQDVEIWVCWPKELAELCPPQKQ